MNGNRWRTTIEVLAAQVGDPTCAEIPGSWR
jgi:hypothetical protein